MYCITIIADIKKEVTSFPYHSKEAWIHSVHCEPAICQNLDKMDSWHSLQKITYLRNYWIESNAVFCKNAGNELHFHNRKSYFDSFKTFEVIDAESPIVIFFGTYGIYLFTDTSLITYHGVSLRFWLKACHIFLIFSLYFSNFSCQYFKLVIYIFFLF